MGKADNKLSQHIKMIWDAGDTVIKGAKGKAKAARGEGAGRDKLALLKEPAGAAKAAPPQDAPPAAGQTAAAAAAAEPPPAPAEAGEAPSDKGPALLKKAAPPKGGRKRGAKAEETKSKTFADHTGMADLRRLQAQKFQMMSKMPGAAGAQNNPQLQIQLMQSETLHVAQEKINGLEEEIQKLRQDNGDIASAAEVLKEKADSLMAKAEDLSRLRDEERESFADEKEVLMSALEEAKKEKGRLEGEKKKLERRLAKDLQNIRMRENSLENRMEIMKWDGAALQRAKDKKIMELQQSARGLSGSLKAAQKKNQDLQARINKMGDSSRKAVAALRATIHSLEGAGFSGSFDDPSETDD